MTIWVWASSMGHAVRLAASDGWKSREEAEMYKGYFPDKKLYSITIMEVKFEKEETEVSL